MAARTSWPLGVCRRPGWRAPPSRALLEALIQARLLVTDRADDGQAVVGVAHEALLHHWPRLKEILDKDREFLRTRARVADAAARWRQEDKAADFLLHAGKPLAEAQDMLAKRREDLDAEVVEYIEASINHHKRRHRHRVLVVASVIGAFFVVISGFGWYSHCQRRRAEENFRLASEAKVQAEANEKLAARRLEQAQDVADTILSRVNRDLEEIPEAVQTRRDLMERAGHLLDMPLASSTDDERTQRLQVTQHDARGNLAVTNDNMKLAKNEYEASIKLGCDLVKRNPHDSEIKSSLLGSLNYLGHIQEELGNIKAARDLHEEALATARELAQKNPANPTFLRDVSWSLNLLGDAQEKMGNLEVARQPMRSRWRSCERYQSEFQTASASEKTCRQPQWTGPRSGEVEESRDGEGPVPGGPVNPAQTLGAASHQLRVPSRRRSYP